jgi:hypothetical protein
MHAQFLAITTVRRGKGEGKVKKNKRKENERNKLDC